MRSLPLGVLAALQADAVRLCWAVEVLCATPIRLTTARAGVTVGGNAFAWGGLTVSSIDLSDDPTLKVNLDNADGKITTADNDGTAFGGLLGKAINLYRVVFDASGNQLTAITEFPGIVVDLTFDDGSATLTGRLPAIANSSGIGVVCTRLCSEMFKGVRCQYAGATTVCDHTRAWCVTLANTAHYGGFLAMPTKGTRLSFFVSQFMPGATRYGSVGGDATPVPQGRPAPTGTPRLAPGSSRPGPVGTPRPAPNQPPIHLTEGG